MRLQSPRALHTDGKTKEPRRTTAEDYPGLTPNHSVSCCPYYLRLLTHVVSALFGDNSQSALKPSDLSGIPLQHWSYRARKGSGPIATRRVPFTRISDHKCDGLAFTKLLYGRL